MILFALVMTLQTIKMTKDIADAIVQLCFDTNALERLYQQNETNTIEHPYQHPTEVKHSIDKLISSDSYQSMQRYFEGAKSLMNAMTDFYKNIPQLSEHQSAVLKAINQLYNDVLNLETLINQTKTS